MAKITGIFKYPDGSIASGLKLRFYLITNALASGGIRLFTATTAEDGRYSVEVPVGRFEVSYVLNSATYSLGIAEVVSDTWSGPVDKLFPSEATTPPATDNGSAIVRQPLKLSAVPVMDNPPQLTLSKGSGATSAAVVSGGTGYSVGDLLTVEGGTASFPCVIRVTSVNAGVITAALARTPGVYSANPANPVSVTGGGGTGATFNLTMNGGVASSVYAGTTFKRTDDTAFVYTGYSPKDVTPGYRGNGVQNGTQMVIEFQSDASQLDIHLIGLNTSATLFVNGQRVSLESIKTDTSGGAYIYTIDWNGKAEIRHYRLSGVNMAFGGVIASLGSSIWIPDGYKQPFAWQMGDSYTFGTGASQGSFNDFRVMCDSLGFDGLADGIGGSGWTSIQDGRVPPQRVEMKLGAITRQPDYVFFSLGYNDATTGRIDDLKANFSASVEKVRELCPAAKIICIGPATPLGSTDELTAIRAAEMELCESYDIPFIDVDNWINSMNSSIYTGADNTHPTDAGHVFRGVRIAQAVSAVI